MAPKRPKEGRFIGSCRDVIMFNLETSRNRTEPSISLAGRLRALPTGGRFVEMIEKARLPGPIRDRLLCEDGPVVGIKRILGEKDEVPGTPR